MRKDTNTKGFTLIELLTVIAIIAMLIALFGAGTLKMKIIQRNLQQKAVFHGMEIGLELFSKDFDGYPDSALVDSGGQVICGAQRLNEAMFGRDERGFNPRTKWHPTLDMAPPVHPDGGANLYSEVTEKKRKGPYSELKHGGIHTIGELWGTPTTTLYVGSNVGTDRTPVITDVFTYNLVTIAGQTEKVGTPILYFKADSTKRFRVDKDNRPVTSPAQTEYKNWVFNYDDNLPMLQLPWLRELQAAVPGLDKHYKEGVTNVESFYQSLTERQADMNNDGTVEFFRPFNAATFVLISAGYDGVYGTRDDITNFNY